MPRSLAVFIHSAALAWERFNSFLSDRAEREVAAWGSSLQYKRRYTKPDTAKAHRQAP